MYDDAGFLTMSIVSGMAIIATLTALVWAAVQDGREDARVRRRR